MHDNLLMKTLLIASDELKSEAKPRSLKAWIHFFFIVLQVK